MELKGPSIRTAVRNSCKANAARLIELLKSQPDPYVDVDTLPPGLVFIQSFNPEDAHDVISPTWYFPPIPAASLAKWPINPSYYYNRETLDLMLVDYDPDEPIPVGHNYPSCAADRARELMQDMTGLFATTRRKIKMSLIERTNWEKVLPSGNSFLSRLSLLVNDCGPVSWSSACYENVSNANNTSPHIILTTSQEFDSSPENHLFVGELAPIISAISNRLEQPEFQDMTYFPYNQALQLSFSGPQSGRILQWCNTSKGTFEIKQSALYSFEKAGAAP
ncbi:uncharacterized protein DSM5745_08756 [Aspergillus mulundensis]|uniref:Uncharacterized protein n=1 Tax=Aspergillus mulundensis TaxID=1810919 RepID=A0A3D8R4T6_9EURO|nr:hypothetical protein DSM5745_08756 [Aspergillus mulundensis]RDW68996.1 hypothetical protein DSM5745_08756 [Aspergillus mulundensis]